MRIKTDKQTVMIEADRGRELAELAHDWQTAIKAACGHGFKRTVLEKRRRRLVVFYIPMAAASIERACLVFRALHPEAEIVSGDLSEYTPCCPTCSQTLPHGGRSAIMRGKERK